MEQREADDPIQWAVLILGVLITLQGWTVLLTNEQKERTRATILQMAHGNVKEHDPKEPFEQQNFELVHSVGKVRNDEIIEDRDFKVYCNDSYRLRRTVEMY